MIKVRAIKCNRCSDTIYSRARHDFRSCSCGWVTIDGGFEYTKISWAKTNTRPEVFELDVHVATIAILYQDWNKRIDKYGLIKETKKKRTKK